MSKVYCVFREGVYRHECCGVFAELDQAIGCANVFADDDNDAYHLYAVFPFDFGATVPRDGYRLSSRSVRCFESPTIYEPDPIYSARYGESKSVRAKAAKKAKN